MLTIFQVCFFVGVGLAALTFIIGQFFDLFGMDGLDLDIPFLGLDLFLPVSPMLYLLFSVVFGGTGWILLTVERPFPTVLIVLLAFLGGIFVSYSFYRFCVKPLKQAENTSAPSDEELIGVMGTVTETIYEDGFGEITYVIYGNSYKAPAKTTDGKELRKGTSIAICWIDNHVFYVAKTNL